MSHPLTTTAPATAARSADRSLFRGAVLNAFAAMPRGRLRVELPDGSVREFGTPDLVATPVAPGVSNTAFLKVGRPAFFTKCALHGDIGFAESYIDGDWETPDLTSLIGWFVLNLEHAPTLTGSRPEPKPSAAFSFLTEPWAAPPSSAWPAWLAWSTRPPSDMR